MRPLRTIPVLPTMFTLGNLVCGFFAIVVAANVGRPDPANAVLSTTETTYLMYSGWLIFLAMIFDALDGHVARISNTTSDFGAQLDSLCDLVTFGVAPAFLLVKMCPLAEVDHSRRVWIIAATFVACAAMRLARFNVETSDDVEDHLNFSGLPSPAAAASIAGFAIMFYTLRSPDNAFPYAQTIDEALQTVLPFFAAFVAIAMVTRIPYPHVVNQVLRGQRSFGHVVGVVFALVAIMVIKGYAVPIICCSFVFYGPVRFAWAKIMHRRQKEESLF